MFNIPTLIYSSSSELDNFFSRYLAISGFLSRTAKHIAVHSSCDKKRKACGGTENWTALYGMSSTT